MNRAYKISSLDDAQDHLGQAFHYAANIFGLNLDAFAQSFSRTRIAALFERDRFVIAGESGIELFRDIVREAAIELDEKAEISLDYSPEYWAGMMLAAYQWYSGLSFEAILGQIKAHEILDLFYPYHEAPPEKTLYWMDAKYLRRKTQTYFSAYRKSVLLSLEETSKLSGIPLETLKKCETMSQIPAINSLSGRELHSLSKLFDCEIGDLLEYEPEPLRADEYF
ncbi:MAG: helix-turn-helix transcriptional regulator [Succinivibrio sp.]|jgi:hypothetical protein|nr:helix-turn-helix transcriptional regulator [Succinivibrio sp.]